MSSDDRHRAEDNPGEEPRVVVRDRRRIDPQTGQVRPSTEEAPAATGASPAMPAAPTSPEAELKAQLDERTADLQRLQAEYANYRKRVDRDREVVITAAKASVATELLAVLDDIERAAQHGDLTGAFKAVADKLGATLERVGLVSFGHEGEPFDPSVHEAVQHNTSPDVAGPTVTAVLRRGYKFGDRLVRAALVAVTDHEPAEPAEQVEPAEQPEAAEVVDGEVEPTAQAGPPGQPRSNDWFEPPKADGADNNKES